MIKSVKIVIIYAFKSTFYQYFIFTKRILHRFVSFCISFMFTYCLFVEKKLVMIKHFLLNFFGGSKCVTKWQISTYILKIVEKDIFLRLQMRAKEMFNRDQFFSTNKQYVSTKLMENETNLWSIFLVKTKYW